MGPESELDAARRLIAEAEGHPQDEPMAARKAADQALRVLEGMSGARALRLRANALRLLGPERDGDARRAFGEALAESPEDGNLHYDYGLLHKWRGRWREAFAANEKAFALLGPERRVLWNLGIAATALGLGDRATAVWKELGMPVEGGHALPIVRGLPPARLRVPSRGPDLGSDPLGAGHARLELPFVQPLGPCHGVLMTPTFGDAPVDYGDVVLWDGAPAGVVVEDGGPVPRMVLLEVLHRGDERRLPFIAAESRDRILGALPVGVSTFFSDPRIDRVGVHGEDRGAAMGAPVFATTESAEGPGALQGKVIVPGGVSLRAVAEALDGAGLRLAIPRLYELLGETRRAGQAHQAWRGIERRAHVL
ncbi:MAG: tetratricopeptide repeat protein [Myxococcales bacterium]|nr:tetratricopeptide repeat protein [Myxococcales bacterium]